MTARVQLRNQYSCAVTMVSMSIWWPRNVTDTEHFAKRASNEMLSYTSYRYLPYRFTSRRRVLYLDQYGGSASAMRDLEHDLHWPRQSSVMSIYTTHPQEKVKRAAPRPKECIYKDDAELAEAVYVPLS